MTNFATILDFIWNDHTHEVTHLVPSIENFDADEEVVTECGATTMYADFGAGEYDMCAECITPDQRPTERQSMTGDKPMFEFDLRMAIADGEGYYVTRWDRAKKITVQAATEREAASKAADALGDPDKSGLSWSIKPYWTWTCDAVREVHAVEVSQVAAVTDV